MHLDCHVRNCSTSRRCQGKGIVHQKTQKRYSDPHRHCSSVLHRDGLCSPAPKPNTSRRRKHRRQQLMTLPSLTRDTGMRPPIV